MLDAFVRAEGEPESVQFSGGEPSIHPEILEMLAAAKSRGIELVMLNTNGIRLARDPRFAPALAELGVHVYLQFDGFDEATQTALRGKPLTDEKLRALDRCTEEGVSVSLAAAIERDLNEHEVGPILRFGVEHPAVTGVFFQPVTHSGRFTADADPLSKLTNSDVIDAIADQPRMVPRRRLRPGPVLLAHLPLGDLRAVRRRGPRPAPAARRRRALPRLRHQPRCPRPRGAGGARGAVVGEGGRWLDPVAERLECVACATAMPPELREVAARGFMVVIQDFQDPYTLDVSKLRKCCVSEIVPDGG